MFSFAIKKVYNHAQGLKFFSLSVTNFSKMFENLGGGKQEWINDGFCDDMNNNEACSYDGTDCCGVNTNRKYCLECTCKSNHQFG